MSWILVVEDDPGIGKTLVFNLKDEGYDVLWAQSLKEAHKLFEEQVIDLILLDLGLPDGYGLDFCRDIRADEIDTPVLVLTATIEEESAVKSFDQGADDYIRKPFGMTEVLARIKRHLNISNTRSAILRFQDLTIMVDKREAYCQDNKINLNRREFDILVLFVRNAERVLTREEIFSQLSLDSDVSDRTIDSHLSHLRSTLKKMGELKHQISSIYGVGYKLEKK